MAVFNIDADVIGLIVRGKLNDAHDPDKMAQHADCILPGGQPVGYFGEGGDGSSGSSGPTFGSSAPSWANGPSISWNRSGLNMKGQVYFYNDFLKKRPHYVDITIAKKYDVVSTVLLLKTTQAQAGLFDQYWKNRHLSPGTFNILGGNCSTNASSAFIAANIVSSSIPGLDTPNNLYKQLKAKYQGQMRVFSGYIGVKPALGNNKYQLLVE